MAETRAVSFLAWKVLEGSSVLQLDEREAAHEKRDRMEKKEREREREREEEKRREGRASVNVMALFSF